MFYPLISLLYFLFMIVYALMAGFIVFHLQRYMIHHDVQHRIVALFIVITVVLFVLNITLFFSAPFEGVQSF